MEPKKDYEVYWEPHKGKQTFALKQKVFELLYGGARGGGKTDAGIAWMMRPIDEPLYRGLVIRKNSEDLADWIDRATRTFATAGGVCSGKPAKFTFPSGAVIRTGHLNDANAYNKYQGHEYQRILIEELTLIPRYEDYEKLRASCRSTVPGLEARLFATTNPGEAGHLWVKEYFIDIATPMTKYVDPVSGRTRMFVPATVEDNPTLMEADPDYVRSLDAIKDESLRQAWRWGSWDVFETKGAYYTNQLTLAMEQRRIGRIPYDPALPVHTCWDLGIGDYMTVWFLQIWGKEFRWIDYYQTTDQSMLSVINDLKKLPYSGNYGRHIAPHDINVRELTDGKTRKEKAESVGWNFEIAPRIPVDDGIDAVRTVLGFSFFDAEKCKIGLHAVRNYKKEWIDKLQVWSDKPLHDWASHAADSMRMGAIVFKPEEIKNNAHDELKKRKEIMRRESARNSPRKLVRFV